MNTNIHSIFSNRRITSFAACLLTLIVGVSKASDCNCAKPKVTVKAVVDSISEDGAVPKFNADPIPKIAANVYSKEYEIERDKDPTYKLSVTVANPAHASSGGKVDFSFPHCSIEYRKQGESEWQKGNSASIAVTAGSNGVVYDPEYIELRITGETTTSPDSAQSPGSKSNSTPSPPGVSYNKATGETTVYPATFGHEISLGQTKEADGYRSLGTLVNYSSNSSPQSWYANSFYKSQPNPKVEIFDVLQNSNIKEKHIITPSSVFIVYGWNQETSARVSYHVATGTEIAVYEKSQYNVATHALTNAQTNPHSYYRLFRATINGSDGFTIEQSFRGQMHTASYRISPYELLWLHSGIVSSYTVIPPGTVIPPDTVIPPAQNSTTWTLQTISKRDNIVINHVTETYDLTDIDTYEVSSRSVDPNPSSSGDELITKYQYDEQGRLQAVSEPDGNWTFTEYVGLFERRIYTPWLSTSSLAISANTYSLPTQGFAKLQVIDEQSTTTYYKDLSSPSNGVMMFQTSESEFNLNEITTTASMTFTGNGAEKITSFTSRYDYNHPTALLRNKTAMRWDSTGSATLYQYEAGTWNGTGFTISSTGNHYRFSQITGTVANPSITSTTANFQAVANHSVKNEMIYTEMGVVYEAQLICNGANTFSLALAKNYEYESAAPYRLTGVKIGGRYIAKTEYVSPFITRSFDQDGTATETVTNADGEVVSSTRIGSGAVPSVVTTYSLVGNTSTTSINGVVQSISVSDAAGRKVSQQDSTGALTSYAYANGGATVTTTRPGNVTSTTTRHFDGKVSSTTGSGVIAEYHEYSVDQATGFVSTTRRLGSLYSPRFQTQVTRWDGSVVQRITPNPSGGSQIVESYTYAPSTSRLVRVSSSAANRPAQIFGIAAGSTAPTAAAIMGNYTLQGYETNSDGPVIMSNDRLTERSSSYVLMSGAWYLQSIQKIFHTDNTTSVHMVTTNQAIAPVAITGPYGDGLRWITQSVRGSITETTQRDDFFTSATSVQTQDSSNTTAPTPDTSTRTLHGKVISSTSLDATTPESYEYDSFGRPVKHTSMTGATTRMFYNAFGQQEKIIDHNRKETQYIYHGPTHLAAGQLWKVINPEGEVTETFYNSRGQVTETTGNGTYRVTYGYSAYGEKSEMRTYRTPGSSGDLTEWIYFEATGLLKEKIYADTQKTTYTYQSNGNPHIRTWARGVTTTYSSNAFGDISFIDYSDSTPDVTYTFDRAGRKRTITDASGLRTFTYTPTMGFLDLISYSGTGVLTGRSIDYTFDTSFRASGFFVPFNPIVTYTYDSYGRIESVRDGVYKHNYSYRAGTGIQTARSLSLVAAGSPNLLTENRYYDRMNRLEGISTANGSQQVLSRHGYELDAAGRRIGAVREDGQNWVYDYNDKGEVTKGIKRFADGSPIPAHTFGYQYDEIGNLTTSSRSQGQAESPANVVNYTPNAVNQYTSINTPGNYTILAEVPAATATNSVTINSQAVERKENTVWKNFSVTNTSPLSTTNTLTVNGASITGKSLLPRQAAVPEYDFDGNLTSDGTWNYTWDAENRLTSMYMVSISNATRYKLDFVYDADSRRVEKTVSTTTSTAALPASWTLVSTTRFLYDEWNLIAEYNTSSSTPIRTHIWGLDLSGSMQSAGGVGGLLSSNIAATRYFPSYDGNGNISAWMEASGTRMEKRDYDPFGALISQLKLVNPTALAQLPFGFSTKYTDTESGLLYYGYRYYNPLSKRWLNCDPIEESGGLNLYGYIGNNGVCNKDYLGLVKVSADLHIGEAYLITKHYRTYTTLERWRTEVTFKFSHENSQKYRNSKDWLLFKPGVWEPGKVIEWPLSPWGSPQEAEPGSINTVVLPRSASKIEGKPVGGILMTNLWSIADMGNDEKCVECSIYEVNYKHKRADKFLTGSGLATQIAQIFPGGGVVGGIISSGDAIVNLTNDLAKTNSAQIRGVICADGKRQIALFNPPQGTTHGNDYYKYYYGGWMHSDPGGATGLIAQPFLIFED